MSAVIVPFENASMREQRLWEALRQAKERQWESDTPEAKEAVWKAYNELVDFQRWRKRHEPEAA